MIKQAMLFLGLLAAVAVQAKVDVKATIDHMHGNWYKNNVVCDLRLPEDGTLVMTSDMTIVARVEEISDSSVLIIFSFRAFDFNPNAYLRCRWNEETSTVLELKNYAGACIEQLKLSVVASRNATN